MDQPIELHAEDVGDRLDRVLSRRLNVSRGQALRLLEEGRVQLHGRALGRAAKGRLVAEDDVLSVQGVAAAEQERVEPRADLPLDVVAQGQDWLIVNKPAGQAVHPLRQGERDTLMNAVAARHPQVQGVGEGGLRSGVVHRLDVTTSGALLVALSEPRWQALRAAFREREIRKTYVALVHGAMQGEGVSVMDLRVAQHRPAKVRAVAEGEESMGSDVRRCSLGWQVVETFHGAALVEVDLHTGFLHQIRVMLAELGHPIIGDDMYCELREPSAWGARRPMLHALELWVNDEVHGRAEPAADFAEVVAMLRI